MGRLRRYRTLALILLGCLAAASAGAQGLPPGFYDRPVLAVDPGRHTAPIRQANVAVGIGPASAAGRFAITGSEDKTARVWSLATGTLERTIRLPAGPGDVGKAYAVAIDPAGEVIAVGGWTTPGAPTVIYLIARATGALLQPIGDLPNVVVHLVFSPDGRYLAATLYRGGVRVFDRDRGWAEVARDGSYSDQSYGAAFAPDGRLVTTSL